MEELDFEFYTRPNGHTEFQEYLDGLNTKERAKLLTVILKVSTYGISTGIQHGWVKQLDSNLYEIRSRVSNNQHRGLYFHVENGHYVITHGFNKKTQKAPQRELNHAKKLRDEYFEKLGGNNYGDK